jgi:hypothetical protein
MYQCNDYTLDPHGLLTHQQIVTQFANPQLQKPLSLSYYHPNAGAAPGAAAKAPHTNKPANSIKIAIISNSSISTHHRHIVHGLGIFVKRFVQFKFELGAWVLSL